ncbi:MAG: CRISPR-associated RAMP protein [Deltaproteobacteria bacterium]|nr:CRISPR-associated RAMP protein [Deltaproteobacteria bacterium]MBW2135654.1 CRISPR-associated RAMP protein [Deltaproteobacteria bacterium]
MSNKFFQRKVKIEGTLAFETAFHIGSGREGELATDMGVLIDRNRHPILPGSTLKGNFRTMAERLAGYLGLTACLLDSQLSGTDCVSVESYRKQVIENYKIIKSEPDKLDWLQKHTCTVCQLFGSPLQASRIFFSDGQLLSWDGTLQVRDGVCIDRDSETARHGAKYDFEVVPAGAAFDISIELENPEDRELALVGAALAEWENGFRLGGFTSRGLGKVRLQNRRITEVDYTNTEQLRNYLLHRQMTEVDNLLTDCLQRILNQSGGPHA